MTHDSPLQRKRIFNPQMHFLTIFLDSAPLWAIYLHLGIRIISKYFENSTALWFHSQILNGFWYNNFLEAAVRKRKLSDSENPLADEYLFKPDATLKSILSNPLYRFGNRNAFQKSTPPECKVVYFFHSFGYMDFLQCRHIAESILPNILQCPWQCDFCNPAVLLYLFLCHFGIKMISRKSTLSNSRYNPFSDLFQNGNFSIDTFVIRDEQRTVLPLSVAPYLL